MCIYVFQKQIDSAINIIWSPFSDCSLLKTSLLVLLELALDTFNRSFGEKKENILLNIVVDIVF